jgi:hypothetical protein
VFDNSLAHQDGTFRTLKLNELFKHNELILKEKGLLIVEQPIEKKSDFLISAQEEIRTLTPFRALPPQSSASTNFATRAENKEGDF